MKTLRGMKKKHENMTYDPSNHLIILHRNLAYSEVSGGHNLHPRCRLRHCHSQQGTHSQQDVYLAVAAKVKNNF